MRARCEVLYRARAGREPTASIPLAIAGANVQRSICNLDIRNPSNKIAALWLATRMDGRCCFASRPRLTRGLPSERRGRRHAWSAARRERAPELTT